MMIVAILLERVGSHMPKEYTPDSSLGDILGFKVFIKGL